MFSFLSRPSLPGIRFDSTHFGLENCLDGETLGFSRRRRSAGRPGSLLAFPSKAFARHCAKSLCQATALATQTSPKLDTGPLVFSDRVAAPCLQADHPRRRSKSTAMSDVPRTSPDHHATIWRYSYALDSHWPKISNSQNTRSSPQTGGHHCVCCLGLQVRRVTRETLRRINMIRRSSVTLSHSRRLSNATRRHDLSRRS